MQRLAILFLALCSLFAQTPPDPAHLADVRQAFGSPQSGATLDCQFTPVRPALDFSFRFQAGYMMRTPLSQFSGKGHGWAVLLKVKPETGEPTYLLHTFDLPEISGANSISEVAGGFLVGEGNYQVQAIGRDDQNRHCRAQWEIEAKLDAAERKLNPAMPAGSVAEIASPLSGSPAAAPKIGCLTILLHAAPLSPRLSKLQASDVLMLAGSLSALLNRLPARSVRLVVFNLERQSVLLRKDNFTLAGIEEVTKAINEVQLGVVDYKTLQNAGGPIELLTGLIRAELQASEPSDEVVFLGPETRTAKPIPKNDLGNTHPGAPRFYYVQYWQPSQRVPRRFGEGIAAPPGMAPPRLPSYGTFPDPASTDSIAQAIGRLKGRTMAVSTPADFAAAIRRMTPAKP
ncbi:MAG: hypothetical protein ABSG03_39855 [Bryobacteraceae bacterium]